MSARSERAEPATLAQLNQQVTSCRRCERLVEWREQVAQQNRRAAFKDQQYWGKPVPAFGDPAASVVIVGLAPAAHGANRTGRMFTGDRSGDFLYASLHRCGLANQPTSQDLHDGLRLTGAYITAAVRCAPPANKPSVRERDECAGYLVSELGLLSDARVAVVLGAFAYGVMCTLLGVKPRPKFGHGVCVDLAQTQVQKVGAQETQEKGAPAQERFGLSHLLCSFHPSQQNTFTGRLTEQMLDDVFVEAKALAAL